MKLNVINLPSNSHVWLVHDEDASGINGFDDFYSTREEAVVAAERDWNCLTDFDRKGRVIDVSDVVTNDVGELDCYDRTPVVVFRS